MATPLFLVPSNPLDASYYRPSPGTKNLLTCQHAAALSKAGSTHPLHHRSSYGASALAKRRSVASLMTPFGSRLTELAWIMTARARVSACLVLSCGTGDTHGDDGRPHHQPRSPLQANFVRLLHSARTHPHQPPACPGDPSVVSASGVTGVPEVCTHIDVEGAHPLRVGQTLVCAHLGETLFDLRCDGDRVFQIEQAATQWSAITDRDPCCERSRWSSPEEDLIVVHLCGRPFRVWNVRSKELSLEQHPGFPLGFDPPNHTSQVCTFS